MKYAKLKKGSSYRTKGYTFNKGIWVEINENDVQYLIDNCSSKIEFAPDGIVPKNDIQETNLNGIIGMQGEGKKQTVGTIGFKESVRDEFSDAEEAEIIKVKEKYQRKREKAIKVKEEKELQEKTEREKQTEKNNKPESKGDISDAQYIHKKYRNEGD